MQLLTAELRVQIPKLYSQETVEPDEKQVYAKFFFPAGRWTWFVIEGEPQDDEDFVFFGFVVGDFEEWGYFTLKELERINVHGLKVERDLSFQAGKFRDVITQFRNERS